MLGRNTDALCLVHLLRHAPDFLLVARISLWIVVSYRDLDIVECLLRSFSALVISLEAIPALFGVLT